MMMHLSAEENMIRSRQGCCDLLSKSISDLDQRSDKQRFLELHNLSFSLPKKFEFQAHKGDEVCQISAQKSVQDEMLDRLQALNDRLNSIKVENEEVCTGCRGDYVHYFMLHRSGNLWKRPINP